MKPKLSEQHLAKNGESAERGHPCDHVAKQQTPPAEDACCWPEPFDNVGIKRTGRGRAPGKLVDVITDKKQADGGKEKAEPRSIPSADKDQPQNRGRSRGRSDDRNRLGDDFRVGKVILFEIS